MTFIKYLLRCFGNVLDSAYGGKSTNKEDVDNKKLSRKYKLDGLVFLFEILAFVAIFASFGFGLFNRIVKNDILVWVYTMLATIGTILAFCLICILVEYIIKSIKYLFKRNKTRE